MTMQANLTLQAAVVRGRGRDHGPVGQPWGPADQQHLIGGSLARSTAYMQAKAAQPAPREVIGLWLVQGMADLVRARGVQVMPGALELLAEVKAAGLPHALVTSAVPACGPPPCWGCRRDAASRWRTHRPESPPHTPPAARWSRCPACRRHRDSPG